jgi:aspartate carbamoyltransferase catalytic subunit
MSLVEATQSHGAANPYDLAPVIDGDAAGKNLLSVKQLTEADIYTYIEEARVAEQFVRDPMKRGIDLLPHAVSIALMRQPSTRTGGSWVTAVEKLGGPGHLYSGMSSSAEAKGESLEDSYVALATQSDLIGVRTPEVGGPYFAAQAIATAFQRGKLWQAVPVINLGNGTDEHPTQALGDMFTLAKWNGFEPLAGKVMAVVGDHERYRAHHSDLLIAKRLGMRIIAVESEVAPVPQAVVDDLGDSLERTLDLDAAMRDADILVVGRNPDEYDGEDPGEQLRSRWLADSYENWLIDYDRLQQMHPDAIVLHPRPRRNELHPSVDSDERMWDIEQMSSQIPMRMTITARHLGMSIVDHQRLAEAAPVVDPRLLAILGAWTRVATVGRTN